MRLIPLVAVLLLAAGCSDSTEPDDTMSGFWKGQADGAEIVLDLLDRSGVVSGAGEIRAGSDTVDLGVLGEHDSPNFELRLYYDVVELDSLIYTGTKSGGRLSGSVEGEPLVLDRQSSPFAGIQ